MLTLHSSNRLERLADLLAEQLQRGETRPLQSTRIAVPSNGMARWLSLRLAETNGIAANLELSRPYPLIEQIFQATLPDQHAQDAAAFSVEALAWRLFGYFQVDEPIESEIDAYRREADALARFELARRVAELFDRYLTYRPDWIQQWEDGESNHWQARLWRRLATDLGNGPHRGHLLAEFESRFPWELAQATSSLVEGFADHLHIFGLSSIPPAYLDILARLSQRVPTTLYRLAPTREYGTDLILPVAHQGSTEPVGAPYLETGHPLLASWGRQGAELENLLKAFEPAQADHFSEPGSGSALATLQSDILNQRDRTVSASSGPLPAPEPSGSEANVSFEACHSPMREVEVLYDRLLALFEANPDLRPSDVLVMTPNIDTYAPYIEAVFGNPGDRPPIPFMIADQGPRSRSSLVEAAFRLLELPAGRFGVNEVLDLLELPPILARTGLTESEWDRIRDWIRDTRIRWGIDGAFRAEHGLPAEDNHTWKAGLDRQLLGYALPGDGQTLFQGILPYPEVEGSWAVTLGRFQAFVRDLFRWRTTLQEDHTPQQWMERLQAYLARFLDPAACDQPNELAAIHRSLAQAAQLAEKAGFDEPIPRDIMARELEHHLSLSVEGRGFLGYGVTFCAMPPMRAIPHEAIFLLGMNDGAFPRLQRPPSFDRMATDYRPGDRVQREDDRYLFLETVLSARHHLGISYVGADIRSNSPRLPSILVSELADAIDATFATPEGEPSCSQQLTTRHPLHAFSPRYFTGKPGLFSYSAGLRESAQCLVHTGSKASAPTFFAKALPEPDEAWQTLELEEVIDFFRHPPRFLLQRRMDIRLEGGEEALQDREPFQLDGLEWHQLRQRIFEHWREGYATEDAEPTVRAAGLLPHGEVGEALFTEAQQEVNRFTQRLAPLQAEGLLEPIPVQLQMGPLDVSSRLADLQPDGQLLYRCGRINGRMALEGMLRHLALCTAAPEGIPHQTQLISLEETVHLDPIPAGEAQKTLDDLGEALWNGLQQPLPFLPHSAFIYARWLVDKGDRKRALAEAVAQWAPNPNRSMRAESEDAYNALAFQEEGPVQLAPETFAGLADRLLVPVAASLAEGPE